MTTVGGYFVSYLDDESDYRVAMLDLRTEEMLESTKDSNRFSAVCIMDETNEAYTTYENEITFCPLVVMPVTLCHGNEVIAVNGTPESVLLNALSKHGLSSPEIKWRDPEAIKI